MTRSTIIPTLSLLAAASLALSACGRSGGGASASPSGGKPAAPALRVRTAPVQVQDVVATVKALGTLEAEDLVQVTAEVEGAVSAVSFNEGDRVSPETVLARIDPDRYRLEAQRAQAALAKAEADAQRAQQELERREKLFSEQLVAQEELNRARTERDRLAGDAAAARAARDIAEQNLRRSDVRPSRAGVIDTRTVSTGQFVRGGAVLATLVDVSRLRLRFKVSEGESLRARPGQTVQFRVAALGTRDFPARIYHVGELASATTRQVEVLAWVQNPGPLKPGFFAEVALSTETRKGALTVPESAVQASEKGFVAYVVEGDTARQKTLQIGLRTEDGRVEIVSGLAPGQTVVVEGSDRLADGVRVVEAGAAGPAAGPSGTTR